MLGMMDAALAGRLAALWCVGYDLLPTNPNAAITDRALRSIELVIVQDLFLTETARRYATVFLPSCATFEKDGTFMNAERRIQRVRAALPPPGASKPDWQIVAEIARTMGAHGFEYRSAEAIWDEVRALCEGAQGMRYARLDVGGLQWPCPDDTHPGTPMLHRDSFASGTPAPLRCIEFHATPEALAESFPFQLITGRNLYQFNAGTMTGRTRNVELRPTDTLDISPGDAGRLGIAAGDRIRITSRYGTAALPARITDAVRDGQVFATFHRPDLLLNAVTGPYRDAVTGTPEYKITAVRLERGVPPPPSAAAASPVG
jgi:formate dehydrogenase major subunit